MITVAARNAAFLVFASRFTHSDFVYSEDFQRSLDAALEAAAPHLISSGGEHATALDDVEKVRQELFEVSNDARWDAPTRAAYRDASRAIHIALTRAEQIEVTL